MPKIIECIVREIRIPFNAGFKHALASRRQTRSVVLEIVTDAGVHGYGEGTPRDYVTGESLPSTIDALNRTAAAMIGAGLPAADGIVAAMADQISELPADLTGAPSARCAVELALLDACGKTANLPLVDLLGSRQTAVVHYSGVVSDESIDRTVAIVEAVNALGLKQVKIKAGRDAAADAEKLKAIRDRLDPRVELRVDANGAWELGEAVKRIDAYREAGVEIFEQPLPAGDRKQYPHLCAAVGDPAGIILDESICRLDDAHWFIENRGCGGFNLKISKHGGLTETLAIQRLAAASGLRVQLGCHVGETSLLTAAGMAFAGLTTGLFACEGAFGTLLLTHDITQRPLQFGPRGRVDLAAATSASGLGVDVDPQLLASATAGKFRHRR